MKKSGTKLKLGNILFNFLAIITVISVGFVAFNFLSGAKGYAVTSQSMAKTLERGDVVFSREAEFDELKIGDVVTVGSADGKEYFTHRIVDIDRENKTVSTKGDNNPDRDPMDTPADRIVGRMWYSVPLLGFITITFGSLSQTKGLIILAAVAIALIAINIILTKTKAKKNGGDSDE